MTVYVCETVGCPNNGVVYNVENAPNGVECGGCHEWLMPND